MSGGEPEMLNKITGCDSRTVPPLYVLIPCFFGESQSLEKPLGRRRKVWFPNHKAWFPNHKA